MPGDDYAGTSLKLHAYFSRRREEALRAGRHDLAPVPDAATIQMLINAAFWASLRREEGYMPKISLAYLPAQPECSPVVLDRPLAVAADALARVSPAVESPGIHLGVFHGGSDLLVWGITRNIPELCFVLEVVAPGLIVVKHHSGDESRKFHNVAVLEGDQIKVIDGSAGGPAAWFQSLDTTLKLAVAMRAHGRGGSLLVVPAASDAWRESIVQPMPYAMSAPSCEFASMTDGIVNAMAGLTAVDGAVVLTGRYELLGFGAKIVRRRGRPMVEQVALSEPVEGAAPKLVHPEQLGGTRHLSAAQFIQDQNDAVALIASQDGRFTVFEWSANEQMVHAHRLDALLL
ncbi:MAG TPA: hypothetical protein VMB03_14260 [Bryobacteraceae bacterium]|nr:hypothetical protein [Bryobacteraceae bacterium]